MEFIRASFRILSIAIGLGIYIGIWVSLILNWDRCMRTEYAYNCWESVLENFYTFWIVLHLAGIVVGCIWAWS